MKRLLFILCILVNAILFASDEIMHISKVYSDGTPKEVIIYRKVSDDLKTNNPFIIVEKINYDTKGNYIRPKLTGNAAIFQSQLIAKWIVEDSANRLFYIKFNRDGSYFSYRDEDFSSEGEHGLYYLQEENGKVILNVKENGWNEFRKATIKSDSRKKITISFSGREGDFILTRLN